MSLRDEHTLSKTNEAKNFRRLSSAEAWSEMDSQASLLVAAVKTQNLAAVLRINLAIGELLGPIVAASEHSELAKEREAAEQSQGRTTCLAAGTVS